MKWTTSRSWHLSARGVAGADHTSCGIVTQDTSGIGTRTYWQVDHRDRTAEGSEETPHKARKAAEAALAEMVRRWHMNGGAW